MGQHNYKNQKDSNSVPFYKKPYVLLAILGIVVFFNTLFNNFVWLDNVYIKNNPVVINFDLISILQNNHTSTGGGFFRPLTTIYYALVYNLGVNQPFLFHALQITFRIAAACLLFSIFSSFFKKPYALFLACIYLVHPLNQSVTAFISNSADSLYMSFGIVSLYLVIKNKLLNYKRFFIFILLLCSVLAKESGVLFFIVVFLYIYLYRRKEALFYLMGESLALGIYLFIRYSSNGFTQPDASLIPIMQLSLLDRLLSVPQIIFYYIKNFFVPMFMGINSLWYVKSFSIKYFFIPLVSIIPFFIALLILGYYSRKRGENIFKIYLFFFLFFCFGLSAYLQIIPLDYTVASRWFIFPIIGLLGLLGLMLEMYIKYSKKILIVFIIIVTLFSLRTIYLNTIWNNNVSLFQYAVSRNSNYFNNYALASTLYGERRYFEALPYIKKSEEKLSYDLAYALEGHIHHGLGDEKNAIKAYEKSLELHSKEPHRYDIATYVVLIKFLLAKSDYSAAEKLLYEALPKYAQHETLWHLFAFTEYKLNLQPQALAALKQAQTINPNNKVTKLLYEYISTKKSLPSEVEKEFIK